MTDLDPLCPNRSLNHYEVHRLIAKVRADERARAVAAYHAAGTMVRFDERADLRTKVEALREYPASDFERARNSAIEDVLALLDGEDVLALLDGGSDG